MGSPPASRPRSPERTTGSFGRSRVGFPTRLFAFETDGRANSVGDFRFAEVRWRARCGGGERRRHQDRGGAERPVTRRCTGSTRGFLAFDGTLFGRGAQRAQRTDDRPRTTQGRAGRLEAASARQIRGGALRQSPSWRRGGAGVSRCGTTCSGPRRRRRVRPGGCRTRTWSGRSRRRTHRWCRR